MNIKDVNWKETFKWALIGGAGVAVFSQLGKIIRGMFWGLILIIGAFFLTWQSVKAVKENSKAVSAMELQEVEEVSDSTRELVKVYGDLNVEEPLEFEFSVCNDDVCEDFQTGYEFEELAYYQVQYEQLQLDQDTEEGENGEEIVTYEEKWIDLDNNEVEEWAEVKVGDVELDPADADRYLEFKEEEINNVYLENAPSVQDYGQEDISSNLGAIRATIEYIEADDREVIVVGEFQGDKIVSGDPYVITDLSDAELVEELESSESTSRLMYRIGAFVLLTIGLVNMWSPILVFTDYVPFVGNSARTIATFISAGLALVIITVSLAVIKFWWLFFILLILAMIAITYIVINNKDEAKLEEKTTPNSDK